MAFISISIATGWRQNAAGADMGFDGKTLHPSQIETANKVFGPSAEEVEEARAIVAAFDDPANAGKGVVT